LDFYFWLTLLKFEGILQSSIQHKPTHVETNSSGFQVGPIMFTVVLKQLIISVLFLPVRRVLPVLYVTFTRTCNGYKMYHTFNTINISISTRVSVILSDLAIKRLDSMHFCLMDTSLPGYLHNGWNTEILLKVTS
jgi:hypothetical protein